MKFVAIGACALIAVTGCSNRNVDSLEAVKQGVIKDISKNVNVGAMDVNVVSVSFRDTEADAVVSFAPKGGPAAQGLTMNYTLERQGGEWHIKKRGSMQGHGAQPSGGQMGGSTTGDGQLGEGRMGGNPSNLPPGHPPLTGSPKQ